MRLGNFNNLRITRFTDHGAYLDGGEVGEILMPRAYVTRELRPDDVVRVFVYLDQEERLVATTENPLCVVGDFAYLRVAWVNEHGAFLHWGVMKDLFVPFGEQKMRMERDRSYIVYVGIDHETMRIVATAKIDKYLQPATTGKFHRGQEVDLLVWQKTPLGFKVIADNAYAGLIYDNQIFRELRTGDRLKGYVVTVREDGRLDLSVDRIGKGRFRDFAEELLEELQKSGGRLPYSDKSSAEEIVERFGVSKKTFKRALGNLYREKKVILEPDAVILPG